METISEEEEIEGKIFYVHQMNLTCSRRADGSFFSTLLIPLTMTCFHFAFMKEREREREKENNFFFKPTFFFFLCFIYLNEEWKFG
jgi:hypothetical protein